MKKAALELPDIAPLEPDPSVLINANGQKLEKSYGGGGIPTQTTRYHGGFQYVNNELQFFPTLEGYVQKSGNDYQYVYVYLDHLGNNRVSYADLNGNDSLEGSELLSSRDYDPFGGVIPDYGIENYVDSYASGFNYLYQGKELNEEGGLNWHDFGSRNYDAALGRWVVPDPANQFASPYLAMGNNPVLLTDPNGEFAIAAVAVGAAIGAIAGGIQAGQNGGGVQNYISGILGGAIVGAVSGAASQIIPISGTEGFISGLTSGAANGFAGGFASGYLGTLTNGGDFENALNAGLDGGGDGALYGGLLSGTLNGIGAMKNNRDFFTGNGSTELGLENFAIADKATYDPVAYTNEATDEFIKSNGELKSLSENYVNKVKLYPPSGYRLSRSGSSFINNADGTSAGGVAVRRGFSIFGFDVARKSNVHLAKASFYNKPTLYLVTHHEFMHAYFHKVIPGLSPINHHKAIYKWQSAQLKAWGYKGPPYINSIIPEHLFNKNFRTALYNEQNSNFLKFKIIIYVPQ